MVEYDFNGLLKLKADGDKTTSMNLGVYMGYCNWSIFKGNATGGGGKFIKKISIGSQRKDSIFTIRCLQALRDNPKPGYKKTLTMRKWNDEAKKMELDATMTYGRDDKNIPYIGVSAPGMTAIKFPLTVNMNFDLGDTSPEEQYDAVLEGTISVFTTHLPIAVNLTSLKRPPNSGGYRQNNSAAAVAPNKSLDGDTIPF